MPSVFVSRNIPSGPLERLKEHCDVSQFQANVPIDRQGLLAGVRGVEGLLCLLTDRVDGEIMDASPNLRIISNCAAGVDNIDVKAATERGIAVTNTPTALTETTADLTWAILLDAARNVSEGDRLVREGKFKGWDLMLLRGVEVYGKTLGIVGAGRIGSAVARRAKGFDMRILYHNRHRNQKLEEDTGAELTSLDELLTTSDIVTVHTPHTPETERMFGAREFALMKNSAIFVNVGRGKCHDEKALYEALRDGTIRGAALDVYEEEPEVYGPLKGMENVVLSPHLGSATDAARLQMAEMAVDNMLDALAGRRPKHVVNPEAFDR
ncbi:MAG: D-glycerate dehydrogenase [Thermoplasmata archaeon]|nr:D-glycerate dehydrogenase [Thermoplasmata archaeon]